MRSRFRVLFESRGMQSWLGRPTLAWRALGRATVAVVVVSAGACVTVPAAQAQGHVYWTNSGSDTIGSANLAGGNVNGSVIAGANSPYGVAVDGQHIYWTNSGSDTLGSANLNDGGNVNSSFIAGADSPRGVAVSR